MKKVLIAIAVIAVIGVLVVLNLKREGSKIEVHTTEVQRRNITKYVTSSGNIRAKRHVDVSASAIGKITKLAVKEGDHVSEGDFLLQIDPIAYETTVDHLKATIRAGEATVDMEEANLSKAEYDLERAEELHAKDLVSEEELRTTRVNVEVYRARVKSANESLVQHRASLRKASHDLEEVRITADITGVVTALNVEEGESAIMGTLNNPGTVLLTIADLTEIEAKVEVDETEVVFIRVGQEATITIDAYPDTSFAGTVTEVGNSAIRTQVGLGQSSVDFKVVIEVIDPIPNVRPGLSTSARIRVAHEQDVLSIPIQCLTVRRQSELEAQQAGAADAAPAADDAASDPLVDFHLTLVCPGCGQRHDYRVDLEMTALEVLRRAQLRLVDTVHVLASSYHWTEREIIALPPSRRNTYLGLIRG